MIRNDLLEPIQYVVSGSRYVSINNTKINEFVSNYKPSDVEHWRTACPFKYKDFEDWRDEIDYRFLVDSQAFCFWGYPNKWTISYKNMKLDGWWAMLASIRKAREDGLPIFDGEWLANLSLKEVRRLFDGEPEIPLLNERWQILRGIGRVLVEKYDGRFYNFLSLGEITAIDLVEKIVNVFPGFDDVHEYKGRKVYFYKKAQLLVNDLAQVKGVEELVRITDLDDLVGKADYKIPALLRKYGMLEYSDELVQLVDNRKEIVRGSEMEVEIRANMLWATELLSKGLAEKGYEMTPIRLDNVLWVMSQKKSSGDKPYHLTLTVDY